MQILLVPMRESALAICTAPQGVAGKT